jgi:hypothetical protein
MKQELFFLNPNKEEQEAKVKECGGSGRLPMEEFVEYHWDVISVHTLRTALDVTEKRHADDLKCSNEIDSKFKAEEIDGALLDFQKLVEREQSWRKKVEARIGELEKESK